jgi:hypothetical protein
LIGDTDAVQAAFIDRHLDVRRNHDRQHDLDQIDRVVRPAGGPIEGGTHALRGPLDDSDG